MSAAYRSVEGAVTVSTNGNPAASMYLDLLKRTLTNTLFSPEPDADAADRVRFVQEFVRHYLKRGALSMLPLARFNNLQDCVLRVLQDGVPGDLIETGVWRGGASIFMRAILKVCRVHDRIVWVADSFEGLPEPDRQRFPKEHQYHNGPIMQNLYKNFASDLESVKSNFAAFGMLDDQVRFLKGWFRDSLPQAPIEKLAVMRLDGDYYESTMDSLTNLYDKLSNGGYCIIDDYGEDEWTNCRQAVDDFRTQRHISDRLCRVDSKCFYWRKSLPNG